MHLRGFSICKSLAYELIYCPVCDLHQQSRHFFPVTKIRLIRLPWSELHTKGVHSQLTGKICAPCMMCAWNSMTAMQIRHLEFACRICMHDACARVTVK